MKKAVIFIALWCSLVGVVTCGPTAFQNNYKKESIDQLAPPLKKLIEGALEQADYTYYYDPAYVNIAYPGGDVPKERGVCADVVVRAFRNTGIDLQKEVHEDMRKNFAEYPKRWGLKAPDANIDHRRVANLMKFFERKEKSLAITSDARDYRPGDIVAWDLDGKQLLHIGLISNLRSGDGTFCIIHNIGAGVKIEDRLFEWKIIGHYRFF